MGLICSVIRTQTVFPTRRVLMSNIPTGVSMKSNSPTSSISVNMRPFSLSSWAPLTLLWRNAACTGVHDTVLYLKPVAGFEIHSADL